MSSRDEIDDRRRQIALFRYSVINELDFEGLSRGEISARIEELAARTWRTPSGEERRFTPRTLWSWWSAYKKKGLEGLVPRSRKTGPRKLNLELIAAAIAARREDPTRSTTALIKALEAQKLAAPGQLKRSTLDRYLEAAGASRRHLKTVEGKAAVRPLHTLPNQLWVGHSHQASVLWDPTRQDFRAARLCAFIDHYSKYCVHAEWHAPERIATMEATYKKALLVRGVSDKTYVESGWLYHTSDFAFAVARVGSRWVHSKAYASEVRETLEAFNRILADGFALEALAAQIETIEQLNLFFEAWLDRRYHLVPHSMTGECPIDRFTRKGVSLHYADPTLVQDVFRIRIRRKVHPKAATVEVEGVTFQCESFLRGRWVSVDYDPFRLEDVLIFLNDKRAQRAFPLTPPPPIPAPSLPPLPSDHLAAVRAEYDRRIAEQAKRTSSPGSTPSPDFTVTSFLDVCAQMLGKELSTDEREELTKSFTGVGPFSEKTVRLALEYSLALRGRGRHLSAYAHDLEVFHLAAPKTNAR